MPKSNDDRMQAEAVPETWDSVETAPVAEPGGAANESLAGLIEAAPPIDKQTYAKQLYQLQVELVKLQKHVIKKGQAILVIFEGRDAAGKDGVIKRITAHLSPRETRVVALGKPTARDEDSWYFERWVPQLPAGGEIVLFNRSWYNRAGVERVMGFASHAQVEQFMHAVPTFEQLLIDSGMHILKYYLDISEDVQKKRLKARRDDPLKQWKVSPIDSAALKHWDDYTKARDEMLARTHSVLAPWFIVRANNKKLTRLNIIRDLLTRLHYPDKDEEIILPDRNIVFPFDVQYLHNGMMAR